MNRLPFCATRAVTLFVALLGFGIPAYAFPSGGGGGGGTVSAPYENPAAVSFQGNQPVTKSYPLQVTSGSDITGPTTVTLNFSVLSAPAGVSGATALSFVSSDVSQLTFTAPNQTLTVNITAAVPNDSTGAAYAGNYAWQILFTGWPTAGSDPGATINMNVAPNSTNLNSPPNVTITPLDGTVNTAAPGATSVTIPLTYTATVPAGGSPILTAGVSEGVLSSLINLLTSIVTGGIGTNNLAGTGSFVATTPGNYTFTATATNLIGTSTSSTAVSVVFPGLPPTITATKPTTLSYNYTLGSPAISVPVGFTVISPANSGNVTSVSASLAGPAGTSTVSLPTQTGVGTAATAKPAGSVSVNQAGTYTLTYIGYNAFGSANTQVVFTVNGVVPVPTVAVATSTSTYQIPVNGTSVPVPYTVTGGTTYGTLTSLTATLGTTAVTPSTLTVIGTASVSGSGTLTITAPGTYTLSAKDTNSGNMTATASTTFTVTQAQAQPTESVVWLPPISCGQVLCGGSVIPVQFKISQGGTTTYLADTSIVVSIFQIYSNGTSSTPVVYSYNSSSCSWSTCNGGNSWRWGGCGNGSCSNNNYGCGNWDSSGWNACTTYYTIGSTSKTYKLNFPTDTGVNTYEIQVFKQTSSNPLTLQLLSSAKVSTAKCGTCYDNNSNQCQASDDNWGNCNVQNKCWGNTKSGSCSWGGTGTYGNCDNGGRTNNWGYNGSSCNKSYDNNSCTSNNWGGGWGWW